MAATPFRIVNWSPNELLGQDKLDQMNANMQWLYDNSMRGYYTLPGGTRRVEGLRIAAGRVLITARKTDDASANVNFNNLFTSGCQPIVTTGIVANFGQPRIFCVINGLGTDIQPDNRGFQVYVNIAADLKKNDTIKKSFYVNWQALGY